MADIKDDFDALLFLNEGGSRRVDRRLARRSHRGLAGTRVHVVLDGKVFNDPDATKPKLMDVTLRSMKAMMFAIVRGDLARLHSTCLDRGMTMRLAAIPEDYPELFPTDEFDPAKSAKLFREGYTRATDGRAWACRPPQRTVSEEPPRQGTALRSIAGNTKSDFVHGGE
jgi:hypothetical protein